MIGGVALWMQKWNRDTSKKENTKLLRECSLQSSPLASPISTRLYLINDVTESCRVKLRRAKVERNIDTYPYYRIITHMKTTIELPDDLLRAAKAIAGRRGTTLKAIITHALEREVHDGVQLSEGFEVDYDGLPHLPSRGTRVTGELVNKLMDEESE